MEILGGPMFCVAGAGESHGPGVTTIVFGCPAGLAISRDQIQHYLNRRRPGGSRHGTPRNEKDRVALLSGVYQENYSELLAGPAISMDGGDVKSSTESYESGFATGEPIAAIVLSTSKKSEDYSQFSGPTGEVRPGHTDLVKFYKSQGFIDIRGGGRSSYRSTISDVIGGSIARMCLKANFGTVILSSICQVGPIKAALSLADHLDATFGNRTDIESSELTQIEEQIDATEIQTLDSNFAAEATELIKQTRMEGDSLGAAIEVVAVNVPALVGEPLYQSLKLRLMGSLGGLHAVRSCEVGAGCEVISRRGSENNDPIRNDGYQSNRHGGMLGGVTTGMPLVCRVGFKPTSTIAVPQASVRKNMEEIDFKLKKGRHDPCVGVRAGVTLESRMAIELLNAVLVHGGNRIDKANFRLEP